MLLSFIRSLFLKKSSALEEIKTQTPKLPTIGIVIQGPINSPNCILMSLLYHKQYPIVISTWTIDDKIKSSFYELFAGLKNIKIIEQPLPKTPNICNKGNAYFQYVSTLNGIQNLNTDFIVKIRSDELFTNLEPIFGKIINNPNKLICSNIFFRKTEYLPYHMSDHIVAGKKENLSLLYKNLITLCQMSNFRLFPTPEQNLAAVWLKINNQEIKSNSMEKIKNMMKQFIDLVPLNKLGLFFVCNNSKALSYFNNQDYFNPETDINNIDEL